MIEQAQQFFEAGDFAAAENLYRKMLDDEPDNPEVLFMLSLTRQGQGDFEEPVALLGHAIRVQPKNPTLHYTLGNIHLRRQSLEEASRSFHEASDLDPNFAEAQNGIAIVELVRGRFAAAEHALRKAVKSDPDNARIQVNLGLAKLEQDRAEEAMSHFQQVLEQDPENYIAQFHLGRAFMKSGNAGFAMRCFENAAESNPDSVEVLKQLAEARMKSGQFAAAAGSFRRILHLGQDSADVMAGLARAEYALGHNREAEGVFLRAIKLAPEDEALLLDYMQLLLDERRWDEVRSRLDRNYSEARDTDRTWRMLAEARLGSGDVEGAMEVLRPMQRGGAPSDAMRLTLARVLMASGEREAADSQVNRLLEADVPLAEAVQLRIRQHLEAGELDTAIERLRELRKRPDLSSKQRLQAAAILADSLHRSGQYQAAWEQMIALETRPAEVMQIRSEKPLQLVENEPAETAMDRDVAWSWPPRAPEDGRPDPTFIFAWPGAGRETLLQTLAGHPGLLVIHDSVGKQQKRRLAISHPQGKGPLNQLTVAEIQMARKQYWKALRHVDAVAGAYATIDGAWLTAEALPTIYRLFPQARLLVLQQAPEDLLIYWLQSGYEDLEGMAATYRAQLELLDKCRAGVPLNYIDVNTQELTQNPGTALRNLAASLELPWHEGIETAWDKAMKRDIAEAGSSEHYAPWLTVELEALGQKS